MKIWVALRRDPYRSFGKGGISERVVHFVLPGAFYPSEHVLVRHIPYLRLGVVVRVICEDDTLDFILCPAKPAFLKVF